MKKLLSATALLLAVMMLVFCLAACGEDEKKEEASTAPASSVSSEADTAAATEAEPTYAVPVQTEAPSLDGTYTSERAEENGEEVELTTTYTLVISGTSATVGGTDYTIQGNTMVSTSETLNYSFDGTNFVMFDDIGRKVFFVKSSGSDTPVSDGYLDGTYMVTKAEENGEKVDFPASTMTISGNKVTVEDYEYTIEGDQFIGEYETLTYTFDGKTLTLTDGKGRYVYLEKQ